MIITAYFSVLGAPQGSLSPIITIKDTSNGSDVVTNAAMSNIGIGYYTYQFSAFNPLKDYVWTCDSISLINNDRYAVGGTSVDGVVSNTQSVISSNLDVQVSSRLASSAYVPPDNADISAIKAQTDKEQFTTDDLILASATVQNVTGAAG